MSISVIPVLGRAVRIGAHQVRSVRGEDVAAGDVLPSGLVLEVTRNDIDGEVRLEMVGSNIHYAGYDEPVTVLASVDRETLDAISLGAFVARHPQRQPQPPRGPQEPSPAERLAADPSTEWSGKHNRGPLGQYAEDVQHYVDVCPIHGETTFARHRAGRTRGGNQRYNRRCLACHSDYNLDHRPT